MTHLSAFDGPLGFATLHPLFTFGPVLLASLWAAIALRRRHAPQPVAHRR
jgi:ABC-type transport system involved in cytochrome c biogenesis permease subunit